VIGGRGRYDVRSRDLKEGKSPIGRKKEKARVSPLRSHPQLTSRSTPDRPKQETTHQNQDCKTAKTFHEQAARTES